MSFSGKNVVLTGVGREGQVGEAVAAAFADRGARLFLVERRLSDAHARAERLTALDYSAEGFASDLSDAHAVGAVADEIRAASGGAVHALVHLAGGFASSGTVAASDPAVWTGQFTMNATTAYLTARAFLPLIREARGALVFFASEAVLAGGRTAGISAYAASKSAVVALAQAIAQEEGPNGVRANAVAPTSIRTAANVKAMGEAATYVSREDVAGIVLWLCSDEARAVNGQVIRVR